MHFAIRTTYPYAKIEYRWPQSKIQQQVGRFEFQYHGPEIKIDQQDSFNEIGMGDWRYFSKRNSRESCLAVYNGIAKAAQEGDRFAREMTDQDTVIQLAKEGMQQAIPELNVEVVPKTMPTIDMRYELDIHWQNGKADIEFSIYPPKVEWEMGSVDITVVKGREIDIKG